MQHGVQVLLETLSTCGVRSLTRCVVHCFIWQQHHFVWQVYNTIITQQLFAGTEICTKQLSTVQAAMLKEWVRSAHADITLVEVLAGRPLDPNEDVIAATRASVAVDPKSGQPRLRRPASPDFVPSMHQALQHAPLASARLLTLCAAVAEAAQRRVALLERLRVCSHVWPCLPMKEKVPC
jgi:hypothetical protein